MVPIIRKLPEHLILKIAAGEVIERPFSVVKELVENSIDAGATHIHVEVEEGGRKGITILDDGIGMTEAEALLALERHATSKLPTDEDLFRIRTLGFRGEALPSIAAVSFLTLETKSAQSEVGIRIEIEGGKIVKKIPSALAQGTRITVRNLFFNTPARLKFLKSKETEFSHVASWIESVALAKPGVGFTLRHSGKNEIRTEPAAETRNRISDILSPDIAASLHPVLFERSSMRLTGFVSDQRASSSSAKSLFFFVNGRIVRDRTLQHAVLSAYENLLMKHRYPWVVLYLQVPTDFVDVNVHPTKSEVKFANSSLVHELVRSGVRSVLQKGVGATPHGCPDSEEIDLPISWPARPIENEKHSECAHGEGDRVGSPLQSSLYQFDFKIIGQVHSTYLICETPDKLLLIDQHAAHERIGFEKLKKQLEEGGIQKQHLLIPQNFDLQPSQSEVLKKYLSDLEKVGLEVEFFGGNTFILRTIPILLEGTDVIALIQDLIESLGSFERLSPLDERIHEVLERMACHRQIRAGQKLATLEIEALIQEMKTVPFAGQCPHGRPSVLEIPFNDMEKWFKRRL